MPFPTPEEALRLSREALEPHLASMREWLGAELRAFHGSDLCLQEPRETRWPTAAWEVIRAEMEQAGWRLTRETSPKNESYVRISPADRRGQFP